LSVTALDTSVIIASLLAWHEAHEASLEAVLEAAATGIVTIPAPALVEAYAVMTRLPATHRLAPADAITLLARSYEPRAQIAAPPERTWSFLEAEAHRGVAGGRIYDALILHSALEAGARRLLTLDRRDFEVLAPREIDIVVPGGPDR
jgi:predicted nucleic acid-binding protein